MYGDCRRKMPVVKRLHQVSNSNTKPEYIRGHSVQVVSLLVSAASASCPRSSPS